MLNKRFLRDYLDRNKIISCDSDLMDSLSTIVELIEWNTYPTLSESERQKMRYLLLIRLSGMKPDSKVYFYGDKYGEGSSPIFINLMKNFPESKIINSFNLVLLRNSNLEYDILYNVTQKDIAGRINDSK